MKKVYGILLLLAFVVGIVFLACSNHVGKCTIDTPEFCEPSDLGDSSNSGSNNNSSSSIFVNYSSSSNYEYYSSSSSIYSNPSSSSIYSNPSSSGISSSLGNSSSASSSSRASSSSVSTAPTCAYQASWCNGSPATAGAVSTTPTNAGSSCFFVRDASVMQGVGIKVNGVTPQANNNQEFVCGQWEKGACSSLLPAKQDGGYYIYTGQWLNVSGVTNGSPNCNGVNPSPGPGVSSSTNAGVSSNSNNNGGTPSYTPTAPGNETSKVTHYWDACKPSCSWSTNSGGKPANACNITGSNIGHNDADRSACDGANAFMCMNNAPWKVGNVSFGYVAGNIGKCGDCYQFDFPNGQVMVVMANNHGAIHDGAKFDLMIPGGGVGDFNALTRQVQQSGVSNPDMGVQYGGFRGKCGWTHSTANVNCVEKMCNDVFKNLPDLKAGCLWYVETLGRAPGSNNASWDNPTVKYKLVTCPKELTDRY